MKNILNKFLAIVVFAIGFVAFGQMPPHPGQGSTPQSGDTGGISQPIDMYVVYLAAVAVIMIIAISRKRTIAKI